MYLPEMLEDLTPPKHFLQLELQLSRHLLQLLTPTNHMRLLLDTLLQNKDQLVALFVQVVDHSSFKSETLRSSNFI